MKKELQREYEELKMDLGKGNAIVFIRNKRTGETREGSLKELFE